MIMNRNIIKFAKLLFIFGMVSFILCSACIGAMAAESVGGSFKTTTEDVSAYESMDTSSDKVEISSGEMILVMESEDGWTHIMYQGSDLYVQNSDAKAIGGLANEPAAQELEKQAKTDKAWIESYVAQLAAKKNAMIWRIVIASVIVILVVLIVITSIRKNISDKKENAKE